MAKTYQMYIGGEWVDATNNETYEDYNPFNGEVFATVPRGKREDTTRAIEAAAAAFPAWAATSPGQRRKLFLKAADIFERRQEDLVRTLRLGLLCSRCFLFQVYYGKLPPRRTSPVK